MKTVEPYSIPPSSTHPSWCLYLLLLLSCMASNQLFNPLQSFKYESNFDALYRVRFGFREYGPLSVF